MKPSNVTIELSEDEIKQLIKEWAQDNYPNIAEPVVTLTTREYGDRYDNVIGRSVSASVSVCISPIKC